MYLNLHPPLGAEIANFLNGNGEIEVASPRICQYIRRVVYCMDIRDMGSDPPNPGSIFPRFEEEDYYIYNY